MAVTSLTTVLFFLLYLPATECYDDKCELRTMGQLKEMCVACAVASRPDSQEELCDELYTPWLFHVRQGRIKILWCPKHVTVVGAGAPLDNYPIHCTPTP